MYRSRSNSGLSNHLTVYTMTDAKMDHRHLPERELRGIVHEVRTGRPYRPLRARLVRQSA